MTIVEHLTELREVRTGPAFTPDDLIDFHLLLRGEDWADQLSATPRDT